MKDGFNRYEYVRGNPVGLTDPDGRVAEDPTQKKKTPKPVPDIDTIRAERLEGKAKTGNPVMDAVGGSAAAPPTTSPAKAPATAGAGSGSPPSTPAPAGPPVKKNRDYTAPDWTALRAGIEANWKAWRPKDDPNAALPMPTDDKLFTMMLAEIHSETQKRNDAKGGPEENRYDNQIIQYNVGNVTVGSDASGKPTKDWYPGVGQYTDYKYRAFGGWQQGTEAFVHEVARRFALLPPEEKTKVLAGDPDAYAKMMQNSPVGAYAGKRNFGPADPSNPELRVTPEQLKGQVMGRVPIVRKLLGPTP